jgi:arylsulfatase A-like enzyme
MDGQPNVLWLMSDQHNANCTGYMGHPNVRTPNLDRIAENGVNFTRMYANNPICSPSRICFLTGQYVHNHRFYGNDNTSYPNLDHLTIPAHFRHHGYQTAMFGKSHTVEAWNREAFETTCYSDLIDVADGNPLSCEFFKYLDAYGLADRYDHTASQVKGEEYLFDGHAPSKLPYEHSVECFIRRETVKYLETRDRSRPFFLKVSFQRPHSPITPSPEHFNLYDSKDIVLPESASDFFENHFAGKPEFMQKMAREGNEYPLLDPNMDRLKRCLASYYALITVIDQEIGQILEQLKKNGELENTIIVYTADHGDFAGEHGAFHKNMGIYNSVQRIPFLLSWPGGPKGQKCPELAESVDLFPTLSQLCNIPIPDGLDGMALPSVISGEMHGKEAVYCESQNVYSTGTKKFRLVYYINDGTGELYDQENDFDEIHNLWDNSAYAGIRDELLRNLLSFIARDLPKKSYSSPACSDLSRQIIMQNKKWSEL